MGQAIKEPVEVRARVGRAAVFQPKFRHDRVGRDAVGQGVEYFGGGFGGPDMITAVPKRFSQ